MQINKSSILIDVRNALGEKIRGAEARFFFTIKDFAAWIAHFG